MALPISHSRCLLSLFLLTSSKMSYQSNGGQLLKACYNGNFPGVRSSVSSGASVDFQCSIGRTPALYCCMQGHSEILQYLLDQGANAELASDYGMTPLHYSADHDKPECVAVLLAHGVAVDAINKYGVTALWQASYYGYLPIVQLLVQGGASTEIANSDGETALAIAKEKSAAFLRMYPPSNRFNYAPENLHVQLRGTWSLQSSTGAGAGTTPLCSTASRERRHKA
jgi:hypothetical protein